MLKYNPLHCLPSAEDLPDSDDTPVDNELQDLIPGLLKAILALVWASRMDWFFGVDMGIYYNPDKPAVAKKSGLGNWQRTGNLPGNDAGVVVLV